MQRVGTCIVLGLPWSMCSACEGMCVKSGENRERLCSSIALWNATDSDPKRKVKLAKLTTVGTMELSSLCRIQGAPALGDFQVQHKSAIHHLQNLDCQPVSLNPSAPCSLPQGPCHTDGLPFQHLSLPPDPTLAPSGYIHHSYPVWCFPKGPSV